MNGGLGHETWVIDERFERALKLIRTALAEVELSIVGEIGFTEASGRDSLLGPSRALLIDCPLLLFEALALDRAAAVFLPLHVLVSGVGDRTEAAIANPERCWNAHLPVGAVDPIARLVARIELALTAASERAGANHS